MRKISKSFLVCPIAVLLGMMSLGSEADARRLGGGRPHVKAHVIANNGVARRTAHRVVRRDVRRAGRWVNGVWIVNGIAASVAVGTASNCGYYYRKWQETRSAYWHDRYVEHCR